MTVHERALIHPSVSIDPTNEIGPNVVIEEGVVLGSRNKVLAGSIICTGTTIGDDNEIHMGAVVGHVPQDRGFENAPSFTRIGHRNIIREYVGIHRGTKPGSETVIGDDCFIMACCHVAHNCRVGNQVTMVNYCGLSGYVEIAAGAFLSGHTAFHQFIRVGTLAMISGLSALNRDVPPYMTAGGRPAAVVGLNRLGLRRAGMGPELRDRLHRAYRTLYRSGLLAAEAADELAKDETPEVQNIVEFIRQSKRGIVSGQASGPNDF